MADEETPQIEATETTEVVIDEGSAPKQLREALKREQEKSAGYKTQLMATAYSEAQLDPQSGLGKAISKEYEGEPTTEALLEFAKTEYGYEVAASPENAAQPMITEGQQQVDALNASSLPATPPSTTESLTKAESEKDYTTAGAIKAAKLQSLMKP